MNASIQAMRMTGPQRIVAGHGKRTRVLGAVWRLFGLLLGSHFGLAMDVPQAPFTSDEYTLGLWHLDEGKGDVAADSGPGQRVCGLREGFQDKTMPRWVTGKWGSALEFADGSGIMPQSGAAFDGCKQLTAEAWVYFDEAPMHYAPIIEKNGVFVLRFNRSGKDVSIEFTYVTNGPGKSPEGKPAYNYGGAYGGPLSAGQWHHVAGVYDGEKGYVVIDGKISVGRGASGSRLAVSPGNLMIGAGDTNRYGSFIVDEARVSRVDRYIDPAAARVRLESEGRATAASARSVGSERETVAQALRLLDSLTVGLRLIGERTSSNYGSVNYAQRQWVASLREQALARSKDASNGACGPEMEQWAQQVDDLERDVIVSSAAAIPPLCYSPSGYPVVSAGGRSGNLSDYARHFMAEAVGPLAEWERGKDTLKRYGLTVDVSLEEAKVRAALEVFVDKTVDRYAEQAVAYYLHVGNERLRVAAAALEKTRWVEALKKTADLRRGLGATMPELPERLRAATAAAAAFRAAAARQDDAAAIAAETKTVAAIATVEEELYREDKGIAVVRPGASFYSAGRFGMGGMWAGLLNFQAGQGQIYRQGAWGNLGVKLYEKGDNPWALCYEPEQDKLIERRVLDGAWTYLRTLYRYGDADKNAIEQEVIWTECSPGILVDTRSTELLLRDLTLGKLTPRAPNRMVAVLDGKPTLIERAEGLNPKRLSEGWLLLLWDGGAPHFPVLVSLEHRPESVEWNETGLKLVRSGAVGRCVIALPYGAGPVAADWRKDWGDGVAAEVLKRCRTVHRLDLYFPYEMEEFFSVGNEKKVRVWDQVTKAAEIRNDWGEQGEAHTPFPPLYALGRRLGVSIEPQTPLKESGILTIYGPLDYASGKTLAYDIPEFRMWDRHELKPNRNEDLIEAFNHKVMQFQGESVRIAPVCNANAGYCLMTDEAKAMWMKSFGRQKDLEPFLRGEGASKDSGGGEYFMDLVVDSVTGKKYWSMGSRTNRKGVETRMDVPNMAAASLAWAYTYAKMYGFWDVVEKNWGYLQRQYSSNPARQLWATPGHDCGYEGGNFYADMLVDGWRGHEYMAFFAQVLGHPSMRALAQYLGSREAVSVGALMHPHVPVYVRAVDNSKAARSPLSRPGNLGARDETLCLALTGWAKQSIIGSVYVYDYALQDCILQSYPESLRDIVKGFDQLVPQWMDPDYQWMMQNGKKIPYGSSLPYGILGWKAMLGESLEHLRNIFGRINDDKRMGGFNFEHDLLKIATLPYVIAAENPAWITEFDKARLKRGEYDADRKEAWIELDSPRPATLCMVSRVAPSGIMVNGVKLAEGVFRYDAARKELRIPFGYGAQTVKISYHDYDPKRDRKADLGKQIIGPVPPWPEAALPSMTLPTGASTPGRIALVRSQDFKGGEQCPAYSYACTPRPAHFVYPAKKGDKTNVATAPFTLTQQDFLKIQKRELAETTNVYDKSRFLSLFIYGKDHDKSGPATQVKVSINGTVVYEGANKCVKKDWSTWEIPLSPDCLKDGQNTLTVENLTPTYIQYQDWFAIHEVTIQVNEKPKKE